jgi:hypothetical protein
MQDSAAAYALTYLNWTVAPVVFQDNSSAQTPREKGRSIVECLFTELLPSNGHGTDHIKPVT